MVPLNILKNQCLANKPFETYRPLNEMFRHIFPSCPPLREILTPSMDYMLCSLCIFILYILKKSKIFFNPPALTFASMRWYCPHWNAWIKGTVSFCCFPNMPRCLLLPSAFAQTVSYPYTPLHPSLCVKIPLILQDHEK